MSLSKPYYLNWRRVLILTLFLLVGLSQAVYSRYGRYKTTRVRYKQTYSGRTQLLKRENHTSSSSHRNTTTDYFNSVASSKSTAYSLRPTKIRKILTEHNGELSYKIVASQNTVRLPKYASSKFSNALDADADDKVSLHIPRTTSNSYDVSAVVQRFNQRQYKKKSGSQYLTQNGMPRRMPTSSSIVHRSSSNSTTKNVPPSDEVSTIGTKTNGTNYKHMKILSSGKFYGPFLHSNIIGSETSPSDFMPLVGLKTDIGGIVDKRNVHSTNVNSLHQQTTQTSRRTPTQPTSTRKKFLSTYFSPSEVLKIMTTSISEARSLVTGLGPGFKVSFLNSSTQQEVDQNSDDVEELATPIPLSTGPAIRFSTSVTTQQSRQKGSTALVIHWWKGENICVKESHGLFGLTASIMKMVKTTEICREKRNRYVCTQRYGFGKRSPKKSTVYKCCSGFRINRDRSRCEPKPSYKPSVVSSPETVWASITAQTNSLAVRSAPDAEIFTIFMPSDDVVIAAFMSQNETEFEDQIQVESFLENHVIPNKKLLSIQMENNQIFKAISGNTIRINFFPGDLDDIITVNCRRVSMPDVVSDNSVVHFIDDVIKEVRGTIADYIAERLEEFSTLLAVLTNSGLIRELRLHNGSYTLFAPTNAAFQASAINIEHGDCLNALARNHIVDRVICTAGTDRGRNVSTIYGEILEMVEQGNKKFIQTAEILEHDIMMENGVIHIIDKVLKPPSVFTILDVLKLEPGFSSMLEMFQAGGIVEALATGSNFTLIVPTNRAFKKMPKDEMLRLLSDSESLRGLLMYHVVPQLISDLDLKSSDKLDTLNPPMEIHVTHYMRRVRLPSRRRRYTGKPASALQCARVIGQSPVQPCNGAIFLVDNILRPPNGKIVSAMMYSKQSNFSTLLAAIRLAGLEQILDGAEDLTFFAPSEAAFSRFPPHVTKLLLGNKRLLIRVIKFHLVPGYHCAHELVQRSYRHITLLGSSVISCPKQKIVYLGRKRKRLRAKIVESNILANNGVIHAIDNLLLPRKFRLVA